MESGYPSDEGVIFSINEKIYKAGTDVEADTSLNTYIREFAHLKGTKYMCKEGGCGSCTVALTYTHPSHGRDVTIAVNSCLTPVLSCHGAAVTTIEGIGNRTAGYHRTQRTLAYFNGTQCGYCSPGMVMNMYSLERQYPELTMAEVEDSFGGNICRCTGYRPILDAFKSITSDASVQLREKLVDLEDLSRACRRERTACEEGCKRCPRRRRQTSEAAEDLSTLFAEVSLAPRSLRLDFRGPEGGPVWYRVASVRQIFEIFDLIGDVDYMIVAGNTAQGVYKERPPEVYIDISDVGDLRGHAVYQDQVTLGGNITLAEMIQLFRVLSHDSPLLFGYTEKLARHLNLVANVPVRNRATLAGNLMIKHKHHEFPSDVFLILATCGASITIRGVTGEEDTVPIVQLLEFNMYKKLIISVTLPALSSNHYIFRSFKIMPRRQNVHALVNAGFLFRYQWNNECTVEELPNIVFGNINPNFVYAHYCQDYLLGKSLVNRSVLRNALEILSKELQPNNEPPEASPAYRKLLALGLFYKFVLGVNGAKANLSYQSGGADLERPLSSGRQLYAENRREAPVHRPVQKIEGLIQCSGEAEYVDDMPRLPGQLYGALVIAEKATSKIVSIDPTLTLKEPGVVAFFSAKDIPGTNTFVSLDGFFIVEEEELFCSGDVLYAGQPVGLIVAETHDLAIKAAKDVKITYTSHKKPLLSVKEVLASGDISRIILRGTIEPKAAQVSGNAAHKISGEVELGSQYHYTMELQTCVVIPTDEGLSIHSATQWIHNSQAAIAKALDIPLNSIHMEVKRCGGAYGAKVTRCGILSAACSLAALKLQRPVRMVLDMTTNTRAIGKRCPVLSKYQVDFDENGKILSLKVDMYNDVGCSLNDYLLSTTRDGIKNCYDSSTWKVNFYNVKTDTPSSTWCRAPGSLEGMSTIEHIMEHIAHVTKKHPLDVRMVNLAAEDRKEIEDIVKEALSSSEYDKRAEKINKYNAENRWRKRGLSIMPMKFGILFLPGFHSMVSIYQNDGTVVVSTGGIEMGQGINTKVVQVVAYAFGIDMDMIKLKPNYNFVSPNDRNSAGSMTTDTVTYATLKCCEELNRRLLPIKEKMANPTWREVVKAADSAGINLNSSYMYSLTDPVPKPYSVYGSTVLEVEVDILTGQYQVVRADIVEDAGESLNPFIDIGQIEGAFVMGLGYFSSEEIVFDVNSGELLTDRSWNYWPPGAKDIPIDFRVTMKTNSTNPMGTLRSKATGEPPLCMSLTLVMGLRHALESARRDAGLPREWFTFDPPCTFEKTCLTTGNSIDQFQL